jgi:ribokinase
LQPHKLISFGANSIDEYYYADHVPLAGDKAILTPSHEEIGGMIGNATSVYASLGGHAAMIDFLPPTKATERIIDSLDQNKIDTSLLTISEDYHQSRCMIMLYQGERIVYVVSPKAIPKTLNAIQLAALNESTTFYANVIDFDRLTNHQAVRSTGTSLAFDVEETAVRAVRDPILLLQLANILFINEQADDYLTSLKQDYKQALNASLIVVTKGANGSQIITKDETIDIPVCPTTLVDTTGAGDTYNASFLYQLHQGRSLVDCGRFASAAAARAISMIGPRSGCGQVKDVLNYAHSVNYSL